MFSSVSDRFVIDSKSIRSGAGAFNGPKLARVAMNAPKVLD
jgi:hypothetical protein